MSKQIEIHTLQSYSNSCLNRDATGAPKNCVYGGVPRARVSSQCLKRTIRESAYFKAICDAVGIRSTLMPTKVGDYLGETALIPAEFLPDVVDLLTYIGTTIKDDSAKGKKKGKDTDIVDPMDVPEDTEDAEVEGESRGGATKTIMLFTKYDVKSLAQFFINGYAEEGEKFFKTLRKTAGKKAALTKLEKFDTAKVPVTLDVALFGRMITSPHLSTIQAAVQVSHLMSTHRVDVESDYFIAKDELKETTGAAMLGEIEFNSACYYGYIATDIDKLKSNLATNEYCAEMICESVGALLNSITRVMPSGKQNTMASHPLPIAVYVVCSDNNTTQTYHSAFERPVKGPEYAETSALALKTEVDLIDKAFGTEGRKGFWLSYRGCAAPKSAEVVKTLDDLIVVCTEFVKGALTQ